MFFKKIFAFFQILQGASVLAVSVFNSWCLKQKSGIFRHFPNVYLLPIFVCIMDYPPDSMNLSLKISSLSCLGCVAYYLLSISGQIYRFAQNQLYLWRALTTIFGNFHGVVMLMAKLFDPAQFVLYWICLFFTYLWIEYVKISVS